MTNTHQQSLNTGKNYNIEALRGFAALFVVWCHSGDPTYKIDPGFLPKGIFAWGPCGHFCVLIFFILSGYVIGLSNKKPLTWATSGSYLKKRLVRLYPIFLLTLVFALLAWPLTFGIKTIAGNAAFLQGLTVPQLNLPAWSLSYEMVYYLLFIFVSVFRLNPFVLAGIALLVALGNQALYPLLHTPVITAYSYGLIFWILGLGLSRRLANAPNERPDYQVLLSCLLFILCIDQYNIVKMIMERVIGGVVGLNLKFPSGISDVAVAIDFYDLSYLPFAFILVITFIGKRIPYRVLMLKAVIGGVALIVLYRFYKIVSAGTANDFDKKFYIIPAGFIVLSLICLFWRIKWLENMGKQVVRTGIWLGAISYGIYLVHFPLMLLLGRISFLSGTRATFALRFVIFVTLTIGLGYILEIIIQPRIRALFFKPKPSFELQVS